MRIDLLKFAMVMAVPLALLAQEPNPTQSKSQSNSQNGPNPIFRVQVVSRSIQAISYRHRSGWTKVDFQGTSLAPQATGTAKVNSRLGNMEIQLDLKKLPPATQFGPEFLTYVLWAITPDGHASNLGEVVLSSDGSYKNTLTTSLQSFGLIITAEPYYAVRQPSDVVVMENVIRQDTLGKYEVINANYQLLQRGEYTYQVPASQQKSVVLNSGKKSPLAVYEAMNAVQIARYAKADEYAGDIFQEAEKLLQQAQDYRDRKQWSPATMTAREAVQKSEDARIVSLRKQRDLALQKEREEAAARQAAADQAALVAKQQADAEAERRREAQQQALLEAQQRDAAEKAKAEADAARAQAQQAATEADRLRQQAENDKNQLRQQLLQQFNSVLPTTETPRGLVVNMQDVLFDTGKYTLKDPAKLALAKLSGIILSHPGLNLQVEGYTDSTGGDAFNQKLSEQRADTVRDFLLDQGLNAQSMTAVGYGKQFPVASNDTAAGRKLNRRVELVVSGEVIGVKIGTPPTADNQPSVSPTPQNPR